MKYWNKINPLEYGIVIYFIISSTSLGICVNSYINCGVDGYLAAIIGTIIGLIPLYLFIKVLNYKPDLNIYEKINYLFNKKIGTIINIIITGIILFLTTIVFYDLLNFIGSQYLFRTNLTVIALIFSISLIYSCTKSSNVIFRLSNILFYISVIISIICILGLFKEPKPSNLLPFLEHGINKILISSLIHVSYTVLPLFMLLMIPKNTIHNNDKIEKYIIIFYLLASIIKIIEIIFIISIFGIDLATLYDFPDFLVLRRISTTGFFQRFESILAIKWIFNIFVMLCISFIYIKKTYIHLISNKHKDLFITIIILVISIICSNFMFINIENNGYLLCKIPSILGIIFIITLIMYLKIKRNE